MLNDRKIAAVSVIIPCFCCANTIARAVASVATQTLRPAEVILVEDFSCDGTLDALYELQAQYPEGWIKVIPLPENRGPGSARNIGWEMASQPYIAFLDADDSWHPKKIEIQYGWMEAHPQVALTGHACQVIVEGKLVSVDELSIDTWAFTPVSRGQLLLSNRFPTRSVMLRRELPYRFAEGKCHSEDYLLWCEIALDGNPCYRSEAKLAYLYKAEYGEAGLSGNLWAMEKGELDTYRRLRASGRLSWLEVQELYFWSLAKFMRRLSLVWYRRTFHRSTIK